MKKIPRPSRLPSDILREDGWCKNRFQDDEGRCCLEGAFSKALTGHGGNYIKVDGITGSIRRAIGTRGGISSWNDAQEWVGPVIAAAERAERLLGWRP